MGGKPKRNLQNFSIENYGDDAMRMPVKQKKKRLSMETTKLSKRKTSTMENSDLGTMMLHHPSSFGRFWEGRMDSSSVEGWTIHFAWPPLFLVSVFFVHFIVLSRKVVLYRIQIEYVRIYACIHDKFSKWLKCRIISSRQPGLAFGGTSSRNTHKKQPVVAPTTTTSASGKHWSAFRRSLALVW